MCDQLCAAGSRYSLPLELLAKEWLEDGERRGEDVEYVIDTLLPTLILSIDKLLAEVSKRGFEDTEERQCDFNPINLLAQCLMRNNPRHTHLPTSHPYCRQLKQISQQLRQMSLGISEKNPEVPDPAKNT